MYVYRFHYTMRVPGMQPKPVSLQGNAFLRIRIPVFSVNPRPAACRRRRKTASFTTNRFPGCSAPSTCFNLRNFHRLWKTRWNPLKTPVFSGQAVENHVESVEIRFCYRGFPRLQPVISACRKCESCIFRPARASSNPLNEKSKKRKNPITPCYFRDSVI